MIALQWGHNGRDGVSNHQRLDCLLNLLLRPRSKKTSKLRVTGLCEGNSLVTLCMIWLYQAKWTIHVGASAYVQTIETNHDVSSSEIRPSNKYTTIHVNISESHMYFAGSIFYPRRYASLLVLGFISILARVSRWMSVVKSMVNIETVSPEGTFCDTVQVPSGAGDMELI